MRPEPAAGWRTVERAHVVSGTPAGFAALGVYLPTGQPVDEAVQWQGSKATTGHAEPELVSSIQNRIDGEYVYGGSAYGHYGHLLLETFARLFVFLESDLPVLFSSINFTGSRTFWALAEAMELPLERITVVDSPVVVERLHVPRAAFAIRNRIDPVFVHAYETIGERLGYPERTDSTPAYLSRSKTNPKQRYYFGESIIEERLREHGINVVHLEEHPIREQIRLMMSWTTVCGFSGTAFHHNLFAREPKEITFFGTRALNQNFELIESVKRNQWRSVLVPFGSATPAEARPNGPYFLTRNAIAKVCNECGVPTTPDDIPRPQFRHARRQYLRLVEKMYGPSPDRREVEVGD